MNQQARAIPFILKNPDTDTYELNPDAQKFLKNINGPLSVVAVAGLYRTGKSYLLNRVILNKSEGFNVGPTINPCTKGLWIWNDSIHTQDKKNVLVIDTQGLGALDEQANHDMKIFCLAVLLSTTFIYNSVGNIDENALQTLSLVLNLVGNIDQQNKSSKPSFIWVVRDFSLQLIDEKGNTISPKQYLQMALNSDTVKQSQKSEIRKNITSAFKQRDCFTLYKPLIDQTKLQKLDTIPLQELRPEFVSQTMALRKKVLNNLQEVKLSNSCLNGNEYVMMVQKYLIAINQGKVPNITDTWTFIKEQKARQISADLIESFTEKVKARVLPRLPLKFAQLQELMSNLKSQMIEEFKHLTYEQSSIQQIEQFYQRIRMQVKTTNEDQMKTFLKNILNKQFQVFSKKILSDYYQSIEEFSADIQKNFKQMLVQNYADKVQGLNASILSFMQRKYLDAFKYFSTKLRLQVKKATQNKEEVQESYRNQIQTVKKSSAQYQNELKNKLLEMDRKVIELTKKYEDTQKMYFSEKEANKGKGAENKNKIQSLEQMISKLEQKNEELQVQNKKFEKEMFMIKKQNDKQIALMKQKNDYLTRQSQEQQKRYDQMKKLLDQKMIVQQQQKKKYFNTSEQRFKAVIQQCQAKSDKIFQLQQKILQLKDQLNEKITDFQQRENKLCEEKKQLKQRLTQDFSNKKQTHTNQINLLRDQCRKYEEELETSLLQRNDLENRIKSMSQQLKHVRYNSQKQIAIHLQRIQFHEAEIKELKNANEEVKKNYQLMIENIQSSSRTNQDKYSFKIKQMTESYEDQIKVLEKELSQKTYQIKKELSTVKASKENLQIELSLQKKRFQSKEKQFKESYSKLESLYNNLNEKLSLSEKDFHVINQEKEQYFTFRIKQLEAEIQENKEKSLRQLEDSQRSSQQALAVLKNYTQMQRHQWEKRLQDEKEKNNRYIQNLKAEFQKKLIEQKQMLEDENAMLEEKIDQMEKYFNQTLQNMKYDYDIEIQKLTNHFTEEKVQINKRNALLSQEIQLTKKNMQSQLDQAKRNYQQSFQSMKSELENEIKQLTIKYQEEKQFLQSKYESLKKTNKTVEQQNLILKNQLDKEKALYKQKQSAHLKNINDLEERLSHQLFNHTKTIEEITNANNLQRRRLNAEIDSLKSAKSRLEDEKSSLAMEKDSMQARNASKITYLENKLKQKKAQYADLMNNFETASKFLNNRVENLQKQKQQLNLKLKAQFQHQISIKQDNYKKENKDYNDRIYRLQLENKSLRDKVILLQVRQGNQSRNNYENSQFQKLEEMKEEYLKRQEEYRKVIDRLKKENRKLKDEKELLQATKNFDKSKMMGNRQNDYRDISERDSIINGLNDYSRHQASKSRINMDGSKMNFTNAFNQSRASNNSALMENKNVINRKNTVSPMISNKKYTNMNIGNGKMRQQDFDLSRFN